MQELEDHIHSSYQEESYFPGDYSEYHEEYEGSPEIDDSYENEVYSPPASPELYSDPEYSDPESYDGDAYDDDDD